MVKPNARQGGVPNMAKVGNCPIFLAENGNVVHISADSVTKVVNDNIQMIIIKISFSENISI